MSRSSYFNMALKMNPTIPAYDSTSDTGYNVLTGGDDWYNPLAEVKLKQDANIDKWIQADATLKVIRSVCPGYIRLGDPRLPGHPLYISPAQTVD